jgi:hypothetical protein
MRNFGTVRRLLNHSRKANSVGGLLGHYTGLFMAEKFCARPTATEVRSSLAVGKIAGPLREQSLGALCPH